MSRTRLPGKGSGTLRLLHVVGDSKFGGEAVIILQLARLAQSMGWHVEVLATDDTAQRFYHQNAICVVNLDVIHRPIRLISDLAGLWQLFRFLRRERYDIVHTHTSKAGFIGRLAARLARVPVIVHTVHGFAFHEESSPMLVRIYSLLERLAAYCCDKIITVSEFHRGWALRLGIADAAKLQAIPNGLSLEGMSPKASRGCLRESWGVGLDGIAILCTSRLAHQKGIEYLIQSVPFLKQSLAQPFRVILAGSGDLWDSLTRLAQELEVAQQVLFLGFEKDIVGLLAAADLVALPSLREGLSISLLEAMAARKAIVTTAIGSNLEVVKHNESALIVPSKDPNALAQAIARLARDSVLRERLGRRASEVVSERFTVESMVEQYRRVYLSLVAARCQGTSPNSVVGGDRSEHGALGLPAQPQ